MAFNPVEFPGGNRAYVGTSHIDVPGNRNYVGGFLGGLGQAATGFAGLAQAAGTIGGVIDNWGAGRRKEKREASESLFTHLSDIHPDDLPQTEEDYAALSSVWGMSPEEVKATVDLSRKQWTPERFQMDSMRGVRNVLGEEAVENYAQEMYSPEAEMAAADSVPVEEEVVVEEEVPIESPPGEGGGELPAPAAPSMGSAAPSMGAHPIQPSVDPVQAFELEQEAAAAPDTAKETELAMQMRAQPVPNGAPDPQRLQSAQIESSRSYLEYLRNQKIFAAMAYNDITHGRQTNPEMYNQIADRLTASKQAVGQGIKNTMLSLFKYVPDSDARYLNDPEYFFDAVSLTRAQFDTEYLREMNAKDPNELKRLMNRLREVPLYIRQVWGPAVEKAAEVQMKMKTVYMEHSLKEREVADQEKQTENSFLISSRQLSLDETKEQNNVDNLIRNFRLSKRDMDLKFKQYNLDARKFHHQMGLDINNQRLQAIEARTRMIGEQITSRSNVYNLLSRVQKDQAENSAAAKLTQLIQLEMNYWAAAEAASAKATKTPTGAYDKSGGELASQNPEELAEMRAHIDNLRNKFYKEVGENGKIEFKVNGVVHVIPVSQDMMTMKDQIMALYGLDMNYVKQDMAAITDIIERGQSSPGPSVPQFNPKFRKFMQYVEQTGQALQPMSRTEFLAWAKQNGMMGRDIEAMWNYYRNKAGGDG